MENNFLIAGVDEVGRGCLAGPVVSAAVILNDKIDLKLIKDSKKINFRNRLKIAEIIKENSHYAIGTASVEEILKINILQASLLSMKRAVNKLKKKHFADVLILLSKNLTSYLPKKKRTFLSYQCPLRPPNWTSLGISLPLPVPLGPFCWRTFVSIASTEATTALGTQPLAQPKNGRLIGCGPSWYAMCWPLFSLLGFGIGFCTFHPSPNN